MIAVERHDAVAVVRLDRGSARNAVPVAGWHALAGAVADAGEARAIVITSAVPGIFSAGADIAEFDALIADPAARVAFREAMRAGIDAVASCPVPVVAAIDGGCFGAAVALTLAADIRVAGDGASFATTPAKLGIGYPGADVVRLIAQVGRGQAARMLLSAAAISADEAARIGLVELRAPDAFGAAMALATGIAAHPASAVALLKATLADPAAPDGDARFDAAFGSDAFATALAAFRARRR